MTIKEAFDRKELDSDYYLINRRIMVIGQIGGSWLHLDSM